MPRAKTRVLGFTAAKPFASGVPQNEFFKNFQPGKKRGFPVVPAPRGPVGSPWCLKQAWVFFWVWAVLGAAPAARFPSLTHYGVFFEKPGLRKKKNSSRPAHSRSFFYWDCAAVIKRRQFPVGAARPMTIQVAPSHKARVL